MPWQLLADTANPATVQSFSPGQVYPLEGRSLAVLRMRKPQREATTK